MIVPVLSQQMVMAQLRMAKKGAAAITAAPSLTSSMLEHDKVVFDEKHARRSPGCALRNVALMPAMNVAT